MASMQWFRSCVKRLAVAPCRQQRLVQQLLAHPKVHCSHGLLKHTLRNGRQHICSLGRLLGPDMNRAFQSQPWQQPGREGSAVGVPTCMMLLPSSLVPLNSACGVPGQPLILLHMCPTKVGVSTDTGTPMGT